MNEILGVKCPRVQKPTGHEARLRGPGHDFYLKAVLRKKRENI